MVLQPTTTPPPPTITLRSDSFTSVGDIVEHIANFLSFSTPETNAERFGKRKRSEHPLATDDVDTEIRHFIALHRSLSNMRVVCTLWRDVTTDPWTAGIENGGLIVAAKMHNTHLHGIGGHGEIVGGFLQQTIRHVCEPATSRCCDIGFEVLNWLAVHPAGRDFLIDRCGVLKVLRDKLASREAIVVSKHLCGRSEELVAHAAATVLGNLYRVRPRREGKEVFPVVRVMFEKHSDDAHIVSEGLSIIEALLKPPSGDQDKAFPTGGGSGGHGFATFSRAPAPREVRITKFVTTGLLPYVAEQLTRQKWRRRQGEGGVDENDEVIAGEIFTTTLRILAGVASGNSKHQRMVLSTTGVVHSLPSLLLWGKQQQHDDGDQKKKEDHYSVRREALRLVNALSGDRYDNNVINLFLAAAAAAPSNSGNGCDAGEKHPIVGKGKSNNKKSSNSSSSATGCTSSPTTTSSTSVMGALAIILGDSDSTLACVALNTLWRGAVLGNIIHAKLIGQLPRLYESIVVFVERSLEAAGGTRKEQQQQRNTHATEHDDEAHHHHQQPSSGESSANNSMSDGEGTGGTISSNSASAQHILKILDILEAVLDAGTKTVCPKNAFMQPMERAGVGSMVEVLKYSHNEGIASGAAELLESFF